MRAHHVRFLLETPYCPAAHPKPHANAELDGLVKQTKSVSHVLLASTRVQ